MGPEQVNGSVLQNDTGTSDYYLYHNVSNIYAEEETSERVLYLEYVDRLVWLIFAPILLVIGLTGNTLSILVLRR